MASNNDMVSRPITHKQTIIQAFAKMSSSDKYFDQENMTGGQTLMSKLRNKPEVTIGLISFAAVVGIGIMGFKKRKISTSLYIVQFRVYAQTAALGCLGVGLLCHMYKQMTASSGKTD